MNIDLDRPCAVDAIRDRALSNRTMLKAWNAIAARRARCRKKKSRLAVSTVKHTDRAALDHAVEIADVPLVGIAISLG
jgi:hypothetical protein